MSQGRSVVQPACLASTWAVPHKGHLLVWLLQPLCVLIGSVTPTYGCHLHVPSALLVCAKTLQAHCIINMP